MVTFTQVDPDDEEFKVFAAVYHDANEKPFDQPYGTRSLQMRLHPNPYDMAIGILVRDRRGDPVAVGLFEAPLADSADVAYVESRVLPAHRNRGIGKKLMNKMIELAAENGRTVFVAESLWDASEETGDGAEFLLRHGFELTRVEAICDISLPPTRLPTVPVLAGYRVESWRGYPPADLAEGYAKFRSQMSRLGIESHGSALHENWDPERLRDEVDQLAQSDTDVHTCIALTDSGDVVGHTQIAFPSEGRVANQWDTIVLPEHRGNGLGLAMKRRALDDTRDRWAGYDQIRTWTDQENKHMLSLNERLGYRLIGWVGEFVKKI